MTTFPPKSRQIVAGEVLAHLARNRQTVVWLSGAAGLSPTTLYRRLQGKSAFTIDELLSVSAALDVPFVSLMRPLIGVAA